MNRQSGFTLVEMMIALLLGLIVVGGGITIYGLVIRGGSDTVKSLRLNHDLDSVMSLMINDIRRAGYWGDALGGADDLTDNPFTTGSADIQILNGGSCILYTYDANGDAIVDSNEYYGFRLSGAVLQIRMTGSTTADCANGSWESINVANGNEQIEITDAQFSFEPITKCLDKTNSTVYSSPCADVDPPLESGVRAAETRQVNIVVAGRVATDPAFTKTLTDTVKVRNDRIFTQP